MRVIRPSNAQTAITRPATTTKRLGPTPRKDRVNPAFTLLGYPERAGGLALDMEAEARVVVAPGGALAVGTRTIASLVASDGTAAAPHAAMLTRPVASLRDLADAVHALCTVHASAERRPPQLASQLSAADPALQHWIARVPLVRADERAYLAHLAADVGPAPSTPGHAAAEAALLTQRQVLDRLSGSDRAGCALGAAIALTLDWVAVRRVLDNAARRLFGASPGQIDDVARQITALLAQSALPTGVERAMLFGAEQMLAQHRGLWHLLEARASARDRA